MVSVGHNKEQHVFLINFNHMTIMLKRGVLVALKMQLDDFLSEPEVVAVIPIYCETW